MSPISSTTPSGTLSSAINSGRNTIASGSQQLDQDAQQIANPDSENTTNALLGSSQALLQAQAGANVISTSDQMLGTLLNIFA